MSMEKNYHKYSESPYKFMAREFIMRLYRFITKNNSIPFNKQYVTLANEQDEKPTSEINQYINAGLLSPNQFIGIDNEKKYIEENKKNHPEANWIYGDWNVVISSLFSGSLTGHRLNFSNFDPSLIYLDSTYFADRKPALDALKNTLNICGDKTLLICNVMITNPRSGTGMSDRSELNSDCLIEGLLEDQVPTAYMEWNKEKEDYFSIEEIIKSPLRKESFTYKTTSKTKMESFIFYKGVLPPHSKIKKEFKIFKEWCKKII